MESSIIEIIDKKASRMYQTMSKTKRVAYRAMLYAGVQITHNKRTLKDISEEIGYSESGTSKLVQKWIGLMEKGDVTVNLIITAVKKLSRKKNHIRTLAKNANAEKPVKVETPKVFPSAIEIPKVEKPSKPRIRTLLGGFIITPEDELMERAAIRSSILFFQKYGKGREPRLNGEYYTPGTNPDEINKDDSKWMPLETAALYCGCKKEIINLAGQTGMIERREYKRIGHHNYYEYKVDDLDRFIRDNHLM